MKLNQFMKESGFKVLALARLQPCESSLLLYLLNCAVTGMEEISTTHTELASLIGYEESMLSSCLTNLVSRKMVRLTLSEAKVTVLKLSFEFDMHIWVHDDLTPKDALVFPFIRHKKFLEQVPKLHSSPVEAPWERILTEYAKTKKLLKGDLKNDEKSAHLLVETHPVKQVLLMLHHFGEKIPSLSLLASSWQHFQEMYESENQQIDFQDARKKHHELDEVLRRHARQCLAAKKTIGLSEDEEAVLKLILNHQHPRRQLYWAYESRERYEKLKTFFIDNAELMLSVTTHGTVVKNYKPEKKV